MKVPSLTYSFVLSPFLLPFRGDLEKCATLKISEFGIKEWDMMEPILKKKKNKCVPKLLKSLTKKYQELEKVAKSLSIDHQVALASQGLTIPEQHLALGKKRKAVDLELEQHISALHCNCDPPEGVKFVNNKAIKDLEHGIFIVDVHGDNAFQRVRESVTCTWWKPQLSWLTR